MNDNDRYILRALELHFPTIAQMVDYYIHREDYQDVVVVCTDGRRFVFNCIEGLLRRLPMSVQSMTEEDFSKELSYNLRKRMSIRQMSQKELAGLVGVSQQMISRYMTGNSIPSAYVVNRISTELECDVGNFYYIAQ